MRKAHIYKPLDKEQFKLKALFWSATFSTASYLDSNFFQDPYSKFDTLIAAGNADSINCATGSGFYNLNTFLKNQAEYLPGFFSYNLKNEIEDLKSQNPDFLLFPDLYFFKPEHLIIIKDNLVTIWSNNPETIIHDIEHTRTLSIKSEKNDIQIKSRFSKSDYINSVNKLKAEIHQGRIYEINFCQEFYVENLQLHPVCTYKELNRISPNPFSCFFKLDEKYIISATPERFLGRRKNKLISQPIKGTAKRYPLHKDDIKSKAQLLNDIKEQSENVMIVDLVRNDLTKSAVPGTVQVEELFGIYSFTQVHQMISTIICEANPELTNSEIIKNTFPMGSMTGAPKINAMKIIEKFERSSRGVFSGAVGYFSPDGDFDFNVVIRSILYDAKNKYLSFHVGSAITNDSDPEKEYDECLLKAEAILAVLNSKL
ncbi:MAG: anthranilate synthase component I family protein [Flavobacterium sp.]|nr:anthranilate synthase component I family protein [Pedobacter sp.]